MNRFEECSKKESVGNTAAGKEVWVNQFTEVSAATFRTEVLEKVSLDKDAPIVIYINSYGGQVDALSKMIETIDECRIKNNTTFITVCMGKAMSCGAVLLSHGDIRFCGPSSRVMVHEVSSWTGGDVHDVANDAAEGKRLNTYFMGLLARNCKIENGYEGLRKLIKERDGREVWMDAKASLEFNIVDHIGYPIVNRKVIYEIMMTNLGEEKITDTLSDISNSDKNKPSKKKTNKKK